MGLFSFKTEKDYEVEWDGKRHGSGRRCTMGKNVIKYKVKNSQINKNKKIIRVDDG